MPRFFFNTEDGQCFPDEDGSELPDTDAARTEACRVLGELLKDDPDQLLSHNLLRLTVLDEARTPLFRLESRAEDLSG